MVVISLLPNDHTVLHQNLVETTAAAVVPTSPGLPLGTLFEDGQVGFDHMGIHAFYAFNTGTGVAQLLSLRSTSRQPNRSHRCRR